MPNPPDKAHPDQPSPLNGSVLPAAAVCLLVIFGPEARNLGDVAAGLTVLTLVVAFVTLRMAPADASRTERPGLAVGSCLILFLAGAVLTALFWYRAWTAVPSVWGARPLILVTQIIGFWWPGVLFAALCRHVSERFAPASRGRFSAQLWWGLAGSVAGVLIQIVMLGIREGWS